MTLIVDIKNRIKTLLDELVTAGTLGEVQMDDFKQGIFDRDYSAFPAAVLTTPSIQGNYFTNRQNARTHTFDIVILNKADNIESATQIETLIETILDKFDNDPTLNGKADAGSEPSSSSPEAVVSRTGTFIVFAISIKAKAIKDLTF